MKQVQKVSLLNGFRETSTVDYKMSQNVSKFIDSSCNAALETENLVKSRVRIHRKMKTKTLLTLANSYNISKAILRIHHQLCHRLRFDTKEIDVINMEKFGGSVKWKNEAFTPVWFEG